MSPKFSLGYAALLVTTRFIKQHLAEVIFFLSEMRPFLIHLRHGHVKNTPNDYMAHLASYFQQLGVFNKDSNI